MSLLFNTGKYIILVIQFMKYFTYKQILDHLWHLSINKYVNIWKLGGQETSINLDCHLGLYLYKFPSFFSEFFSRNSSHNGYRHFQSYIIILNSQHISINVVHTHFRGRTVRLGKSDGLFFSEKSKLRHIFDAV